MDIAWFGAREPAGQRRTEAKAVAGSTGTILITEEVSRASGHVPHMQMELDDEF